MAFYVGQRVVCVDDSISGYGKGRSDHPHRLRGGQIYTVRDVGINEQICDDAIPVLWLEGVTRLNCYGQDVGYAAARSRPVVERKTSIETFTAMLNPSDKRVEA